MAKAGAGGQGCSLAVHAGAVTSSAILPLPNICPQKGLMWEIYSPTPPFFPEYEYYHSLLSPYSVVCVRPFFTERSGGLGTAQSKESQDDGLAGVSNPWPMGYMRPRMAMNAAQYKILNLLKTIFSLISFC